MGETSLPSTLMTMRKGGGSSRPGYKGHEMHFWSQSKDAISRACRRWLSLSFSNLAAVDCRGDGEGCNPFIAILHNLYLMRGEPHVHAWVICSSCAFCAKEGSWRLIWKVKCAEKETKEQYKQFYLCFLIEPAGIFLLVVSKRAGNCYFWKVERPKNKADALQDSSTCNSSFFKTFSRLA